MNGSWTKPRPARSSPPNNSAGSTSSATTSPPALSIDPEDLELSPFNQRGGLGKAHQLFGEKLPGLLEELNTILAA